MTEETANAIKIVFNCPNGMAGCGIQAPQQLCLHVSRNLAPKILEHLHVPYWYLVQADHFLVGCAGCQDKSQMEVKMMV